MKETRRVILTIERTVAVDVDDEAYTISRQWEYDGDGCGHAYDDVLVDEDFVRALVRSTTPYPKGWDVVEEEIEDV